MSSTNQTIAVPLRRRLHALSWLVLLFLSAAMTVIVIPGMPEGPNAWISNDTYVQSHGWPWTYLQQTAIQGDCLISWHYYPASWSSRSAWPFSGSVNSFDWIVLTADIAIGLAIIAIGTAACERWRRRQGGWQFSLIDGAVITACVCAVLAWWEIHARVNAGEESALAALNAPNGTKSAYLRAEGAIKYCGPDWLRRLIGNEECLPSRHLEEIDVVITLLSSDDCAAIRQLSHLSKVHFVGELRRQVIEALATLPRLKILEGTVDGSGGNSLNYPLIGLREARSLRGLKHLTTLDLGSLCIDPADLTQICLMPHLQYLSLRSMDLLIEDLDPVVDCPTLKTLSVLVNATEAERKAFCAAHPQLKVEWLPLDPPPEPRAPSDDAWDVVAVLMHRWQFEDYGDESRPENGGLDFSGIRLTEDRLARVPPEIFPETAYLDVGHADTATAMKLIRLCNHARVIDARNVQLTKKEIDSFSMAEDSSELYVAQGNITAQEFCDIVHRMDKCSLTIYYCWFTSPELRRIHAAALPESVTFYKGSRNDDSEQLKMAPESAVSCAPSE